MRGDGMPVVLGFLSEGVRQASETLHSNSRRQVLAFRKARRDEAALWHPRDVQNLAADAIRWAIFLLRGIATGRVYSFTSWA
jgi:hypothetical protein